MALDFLAIASAGSFPTPGVTLSARAVYAASLGILGSVQGSEQIVQRGGNFFEITGIAGDLTSEEIFRMAGPTGELKVKSIRFFGGTGGILVVKQGDENGPTIATLATASAVKEDRIIFEDGGQFMIPFIDFSECTLKSGHKVVFEVE